MRAPRSRSRTPSTPFTASATCVSRTRRVTKRSATSPGVPSRAPKSTTGVGIPRMIATPLTNDGAPATGSTAKGRMVSITCPSGSAHNRPGTSTTRVGFDAHVEPIIFPPFACGGGARCIAAKSRHDRAAMERRSQIYKRLCLIHRLRWYFRLRRKGLRSSSNAISGAEHTIWPSSWCRILR
jgi:hypothetical protein